MILELHNVIMEPSNVRKKNKRTTICQKRTIKFDVGTAQCEDKIVKRKKNSKGIIKYEKIIITCDVGTAQCEDETVKYEKKVRKPPNVRKELSHMMLELHNVKMKPLSVRKK